MARLSPFVPLARFQPFRPGYGLSGLCFSDTLYNLTICEKRCYLCPSIEMSTWFTREFAETVQSRHKKRFTANCLDHREMKSLLLVKQKLKYRLQRTRQSARSKESRTLVLEAIGKLCRHGTIIYCSSQWNGKN